MNTKILVALELGVPLVITPVAASPFDLPENETIVAFANQALDFVQEVKTVYTVSWLWTKLSRASRQHWENLATHDPARRTCADALHRLPGHDPRPLQARVDAAAHPGEPASPLLRPPPPRSKAAAPRPSTCFAGGNWSGRLVAAAAPRRLARDDRDVPQV